MALRLAGLDVTDARHDRKLIAIDRLAIAAGDRIALLGANGAGKSTLLSALAAAFDPELEHYDGQAPVRFNPACRLVYFDQSHARPAARPVDPRLRRRRPRRHREGRDPPCSRRPAFAFAKIGEPIGVLSHGERARLVFLKMKLLRPNFYLLDEPTNHLDIEGQEDLEAQLEQQRRVVPVRQPRPLLHPHRRRRASSRSARAGWSRSTMPRASSTGEVA